MINMKRCAKINIKVLIVLFLVVVAVGISLFTARHIRRSFLTKMALDAGQKAYGKEDWQAAYRNFGEYLGRNPEDIEILKKYAKAALSIRPFNQTTINRAITAYRQVMRLDPKEEAAYDKLAELYTSIGNYEELAYVARTKMEHSDPNQPKARLWLGEALFQMKKTAQAKDILQKLVDDLSKEHLEYDYKFVHAYLLMSRIVLEEDTFNAEQQAQEFLDAAVDYDPNSVEALLHRAWFSRRLASEPIMTEETRQERLKSAQEDLDTADALKTDDPQLLLLLAVEWMAQGNLERSEKELEIADSLSRENIQEHFFNYSKWIVAKFQLAARLALLTQNFSKGISLSDETLKVLEEKQYRVEVLPLVIQLYVAGDRVEDANDLLYEYVEILRIQEAQPEYMQTVQLEHRQQLPYLRALVAKAKNDSYAVINTLQPAVLSNDRNPELWGLLAEAFIRTSQTRRAVNALSEYLLLRPQDVEVRLQLAKEYLKLRDWSNALKAAQSAETLDPAEILAKLLRIEARINVVAEQQKEAASVVKLEALREETEELARLREENPDRVDVYILQAMIASYLDDPNTAEKQLKLAIEECEEPLRAEIQLSRFYYRNKRITEAISRCRSSCDDHPDVAEPWLLLSELYVANEDYDSARSCLKKAQDVVLDKWQKRSISIKLALLELNYGDRTYGINILNQIATEDKREVRARFLLLDISEVQNDSAKTQQLIDELKEAEGESGLMWRLCQSAIWLKSDQWRLKQRDITAHLQNCIDLNPEWSAPYVLLAEMYDKLEDFERLEETYRQALIRNPSATEIVDRLVTLLEKQGRFSEAEELLRNVNADQRASVLRIQAYLREGNLERAVEELKLRISSDKQDINSRILLARLIYSRDQDKKTALKYLDDAEAIKPNTLAIVAARVAILKAEGNTEETRRILNGYVENNDDFQAYMIRALYFENEGDFEDAEQDYMKLTTFTEQGAMGYELQSDFYFRNEKYDKAVHIIEQGLNQYPDDLRLKRRLMKTLLATSPAQDQPRALSILSELEEHLRQDPELMFFRAQQILRESPESLATVIEKLKTVVKLEPTAVAAYLLLIDILCQQEDYENARDYAIRAIGSNPNNFALLLARSKVEIELNNTRMAVQLAKVVLQNDPNNARARDMISLAALRSDDHRLIEEAQKLIQSAIPDNPVDEKLLLIEVVKLAKDQENPQPGKAIPLLETYSQTKQGSTSINAIVTLADLYRLSGDMDKSRQLIEQAEKTNPNNQIAVHARFLWLVAQKRFEELENISSAYISAKEQNPTTIMKAATILITLDSMTLKKEGLKLYRHAEAMTPTLLNEKMDFASVLYQKGNAEQAEKIYRELLQQHPNNIRILNDLAWIIQEHSHRYTDALELANKGLSLEPTNINLIDTRGTILSNLPDRIIDARNDFEKLVQLSPPDTPQQARALLQLGRICVKLNDIDKAKQHLNKALEIDKKIDIDLFTPEELSEIMQIIQKTSK